MDPDEKIIYHTAPYIQYEQFRLNDLYRQQFRNSFAFEKNIPKRTSKILNKNILRISSPRTIVSYRQFDWLEISLVYNKSNQHGSIYDSYNWLLKYRTIDRTGF